MADRDYHKDNKSFIVYKDWEEIILALGSDEDRARLFRALFSYASSGEQPVDFTGALKVAFTCLKSALDRDGQKWEKTCDVRAVNGAKGGAPKGNQNARKKQAKQANGYKNNLKQAKQADNDTETETDIDTDIDSVIEKEKENDSVSPSAPDFSAVELTQGQLSSLVFFYSQPRVDLFISKAREWQIKNKRKYKDPYKTIKGWLEAEKAMHPVGSDKEQSYTVEMLESLTKNFVARNSHLLDENSKEGDDSA